MSEDFNTYSRGRKKSNFPAATSVSSGAYMDFFVSGTNYKISYENFIAGLGVTGSLEQAGASTGTPVLDIDGTVNKIRSIEAGSGITTSVSAENGITISATGGSIFDSLTEVGQIPSLSANLIDFEYSGATRDPDTGQITFDNPIQVPAGSIDVGTTITLSEGGQDLIVTDLVNDLSSFSVNSKFDDATGASVPTYVDWEEPQDLILQPVFDTVITTNPLTFTAPSTVVAPYRRLTDKAIIKANSEMTNYRLKITDQATGIVLRYVPNRAAYEGNEEGLTLGPGDVTFYFFADGEDTATEIYLGRVPFVTYPDQIIDIEVVADEIDILGNSSEIPYFEVEVHDGLEVVLSTGSGSGDVVGPGVSVDNALSTWNGTGGDALNSISGALLTQGAQLLELGLYAPDSPGAASLVIYDDNEDEYARFEYNATDDAVKLEATAALEITQYLNAASLTIRNESAPIDFVLGSGLPNVPLFSFQNLSSGIDSQIFLVTADPEGSLTANPGDFAFRNTGSDNNNGIYVKQTGISNTGWEQLGTGGGSGDVSGPGTSVDNALSTWNGVDGDALNSVDNAILTDDGSTAKLEIFSPSATGIAYIELSGTDLSQYISLSYNENVGLSTGLFGDLFITSGSLTENIRSANNRLTVQEYLYLDHSDDTNFTAQITPPGAAGSARLNIFDDTETNGLSLYIDQGTSQSIIESTGYDFVLQRSVFIEEDGTDATMTILPQGLTGDSRINLYDDTGVEGLALFFDQGFEDATISAVGTADLLITQPESSAAINIRSQGGDAINLISGGAGSQYIWSAQSEGVNGGTVDFHVFAGDPNGNITGNRGDISYRTSSNNGEATVYVKRNAGDGTNTGWVDLFSSGSGDVSGPGSSTVGSFAYWTDTGGTTLGSSPTFTLSEDTFDATFTMTPVAATGEVSINFENTSGDPELSIGFDENLIRAEIDVYADNGLDFLVHSDALSIGVGIVGLATSDADRIFGMSTQGNNGSEVSFLVGDRDPTAAVVAGGGTFYWRGDGVNSSLYVKQSAAVDNSGWFDLATAGSGDVSGPGSSTDNAIATWDGTGGDTIQSVGSARITETVFGPSLVLESLLSNGSGQINFVPSAGGDVFDIGYFENANTADISVGAGVNLDFSSDLFGIVTDGTNSQMTMQAGGATGNASITLETSVGGLAAVVAYDESAGSFTVGGGLPLTLVGDNFNLSDDGSDHHMFIDVPAAGGDADIAFRSSSNVTELIFGYDETGDSAFIDSTGIFNLNSGPGVFDLSSASDNAYVAVLSGTPEGVITAPRGSIALRNSGVDGTSSLYFKATGVGNTGWVDVLSSGSGDVSGPGSSIDNAFSTWNGTDGDTLNSLDNFIGVDDGTNLTLTATNPDASGITFFNIANSFGSTVMGLGWVESLGNAVLGLNDLNITSNSSLTTATVSTGPLDIDVAGGVTQFINNQGNTVRVNIVNPLDTSTVEFGILNEGGGDELVIAHDELNDLSTITSDNEFRLTSGGVMQFINTDTNDDISFNNAIFFGTDSQTAQYIDIYEPNADDPVGIRLFDSGGTNHAVWTYTGSTNIVNFSTLNSNSLGISSTAAIVAVATTAINFTSATATHAAETSLVLETTGAGDVDILATDTDQAVNIQDFASFTRPAGTGAILALQAQNASSSVEYRIETSAGGTAANWVMDDFADTVDFTSFGGRTLAIRSANELDLFSGNSVGGEAIRFGHTSLVSALYLETASPNGSVSADPGDTATRLDGTSSSIYVNVGTADGNSVWKDLGAAMVFTWGDGSVGNTLTERYLTPGYDQGQAPTTRVNVPVPRDGYIQNFYVHHNEPGTDALDIVYIVEVNQVATALAVQLQADEQDGNDTVDRIAVSAGDLLTVAVTKPAVLSDPPVNITATLEFV